jgi:hypothetical protein
VHNWRQLEAAAAGAGALLVLLSLELDVELEEASLLPLLLEELSLLAAPFDASRLSVR